MASRPLQSYDHVRVVGKHNDYNGHNAVVLYTDEDGISVRVQIKVNDSSVCKWYLNEDLVIRHSPTDFINDGRYDAEAAESYRIRQTERMAAAQRMMEEDNDDDDDDQMFNDMDIDDVKALYFKCERLEEENERLKQVIKTLQGVA